MSGNPKGFPLLFYPLFSRSHSNCQQTRHIVHDNMKIFTLFNYENLHLIDFFPIFAMFKRKKRTCKRGTSPIVNDNK